jgi:RimJ/RimL family protein N-acetyltransferase
LVNAGSEPNFKNYISIALKNRANKIEYPFTVFDKKIIHFKSLQLGYKCYCKNFRGIGFNLLCKYLLLEFGFEKMLKERFKSKADYNNRQSIAAM